MHKTIYVTKFCPETKRVTEPAKPSGFNSIEEVTMLMGPPLVLGKRAVTYRSVFYSEYYLHTHADNDSQKVFLNREA